MQGRSGGRPLSHFATVSTSSTSLVCESELEVNFRLLHLPCEILLAFQWCCPSSHLPRMQKRDRGCLFSHFDDAAPSSISLACKVSQMWTPGFSTSLLCKSEPGVYFLAHLDAVAASSTSLACNSELEVIFIHVSMRSAPPPPHATVFIWRFDAACATTTTSVDDVSMPMTYHIT